MEQRFTKRSVGGVGSQEVAQQGPLGIGAMTGIDTAAGTVECECDGTRHLVAFGGYAHMRRPFTAQGRPPTGLVTLPRPQEWPQAQGRHQE